jgi:hypothetical protein
MKYKQADKPKIIVLSVALFALLLYIGVRSVQLSREWKGKTAAAEARHQLAHASMAEPGAVGVPASTGEPPSLVESNPRLRALMYSGLPPERDPFYPVIRRPRAGRPAVKRPAADRSTPTALPPLGTTTGLATPARDSLRITGIITGSPPAAVLRVGDQHYVVREGDWINDSVRVQTIDTSTVTLRDGKRSYTLRLGR